MAHMTQSARSRIFSELATMGIGYDIAAKLLRYGTTLHRLAVAQCNGDWPADNGERKTGECVACKARWAPAVLKMGKIVREDGETVKLKSTCPDCRASSAALLTAKAAGLSASFGGDPRGSVFSVTKDGKTVYLA